MHALGPKSPAPCTPCRTPPNDIVVHIRMLDRTAQLQQEAVGVLGINLIHAAFTGGDDTAAIIGTLLEELSRSRIEARARLAQAVAPCLRPRLQAPPHGCASPLRGVRRRSGAAQRCLRACMQRTLACAAALPAARLPRMTQAIMDSQRHTTAVPVF